MVAEFTFKQFRVSQEKCAMKVGTDAVLIGSWADVSNAQRILDVGTGSGVIALMMAQRSEAGIEAVEIDKNSCEEAVKNILQSKWKDRVIVHHGPFQDFADAKPGTFDLIVSNPPFFIDSSKASLIGRTTARHTDLLSYKELIEGVNKILHPDGKFCLILPLKEGEMFMDFAKEQKLHLTKLTRVRTTHEKATNKRLLMQYQKKPTCFKEDTLIIEKGERHTYTDEYKELTKEFYLNF